MYHCQPTSDYVMQKHVANDLMGQPAVFRKGPLQVPDLALPMMEFLLQEDVGLLGLRCTYFVHGTAVLQCSHDAA